MLYIWFSTNNNSYTGILLDGLEVIKGDAYATSYAQEITTNLIKIQKTRTMAMQITNHKCTQLEMKAYSYRRIGSNV